MIFINKTDKSRRKVRRDDKLHITINFTFQNIITHYVKTCIIHLKNECEHSALVHIYMHLPDYIEYASGQ